MNRTLLILPYCSMKPNHVCAQVNAALQISSDEVHALWIGRTSDAPPLSLPNAISKLYTYHLDQETLPTAQQATQIINSIPEIKNTHIVMQSSTQSKELLPRMGALNDIMPITDVIAINQHVFSRPIFAGNIIEKVTAPSPFYLSIRSGQFKGQCTDQPIESQPLPQIDNLKQSTAMIKSVQIEEQDLSSAPLVMSGGRGLGSEENFKKLANLARSYGAALGASRVAVDLGYISNDHQVGQTGKIISPDVYIAFGISGAVQHLAGMKDSGKIVVINKDPSAPLFEQCDLGYTGDLFDVIARLESK